MTSASAATFPIRHGSRLTSRSALNVIFSSELPRSSIARTLLGALLSNVSNAVAAGSPASPRQKANALRGVENR